MPAALLVVFVGIVVAIVQYPMVVRALRLGPSIPRIIVPTAGEWKTGGARSLNVALHGLFAISMICSGGDLVDPHTRILAFQHLMDEKIIALLRAEIAMLHWFASLLSWVETPGESGC